MISGDSSLTIPVSPIQSTYSSLLFRMILLDAFLRVVKNLN